MFRNVTLLFALVLMSLPLRHSQGAKFLGLGDLPGGGFLSEARATSADGSVVVGYSVSAAGYEAFRWTSATGIVGLGDLPDGAFFSSATGTSADGSVVVGLGNSAAGPGVFRWTSASGMVGLPDPAFGRIPTGTSADGSVIVGYSNSFAGTDGFRWNNASGMVALGDLPDGAFSSRASAVSADGSIIVGFGNSALGTEAFRWTSATGMVGLGDLPDGAFGSEAQAASSDGSVIVGTGSSALGLEAFRWTGATGMVGLGDLPGGAFESNAKGSSADGSIIVGESISVVGAEAFIWTSAFYMQSVKEVLLPSVGAALDGWTLTFAAGVSGDGRTIVGYGTNPQGNIEAWLAYLPDQIYWYPETSGAWDADSSWSGPFLPGPTDDVVIDPSAAITVTGPAAHRRVHTLQLGGSGLGRVTLSLNSPSGGDLTADAYTHILPDGELLLDSGRSFTTPALFNYGVIRGRGTVNAILVNFVGAEVRVAAGESLVVSGNSHTNEGKIEAIGGAIEFVGPLTNAATTGLITGRGATLRFAGGLTNDGAVALSTGISDITGALLNNGSVIVSGHATTTFYDDVRNDGTINVAAGSVAVFFGELAGNGVGGAGEVFIEGDMRPGASPGVMAFGGDIMIGPFAETEIELSGHLPDTEYDVVLIDGLATLNGVLRVSLLDDFLPAPGDAFTILSASGGLTGTFAEELLPSLGGGIAWDVLYTSHDVTLRVLGECLVGDTNPCNGRIDINDLNAVRNNFGATGSNDGALVGDTYPFDGFVKIDDLNAVRNNFGAIANARAVPEPSSQAMAIMIGCVALSLSTLRRRRG